MSTLTTRQEQQLIDRIARALSWSAENEEAKLRFRTRAIQVVRELTRDANAGNAIQLKHALERIVDREQSA